MPLGSQHGPQNPPKTVPTSTQNRSKIFKKSTQNPLMSRGSGLLEASWEPPCHVITHSTIDFFGKPEGQASREATGKESRNDSNTITTRRRIMVIQNSEVILKLDDN